MFLLSSFLKSAYWRQDCPVPVVSESVLNVFEVSLPFIIHILDKFFFNRRVHSEFCIPKIMVTFLFLVEETLVFLAVCDSFKFLVFRLELAKELF